VLVGDSRCAALGELSGRRLKKPICFVALDRFRINVQKSTLPLINLRAPCL
jgi:hypothetical protein